MNPKREPHVNLADYRPLPEDEEGLTPHQIQERRAARLLVSFRRYDAEMNRESAEVVMELPMAELMRQLEVDEDQARDLKKLAKRQLMRCELAGVGK